MSGLYRAVIGVLDKLVPQALKPVWDHPAGRYITAFLPLLRK